jgi:hypothetical protein
MNNDKKLTERNDPQATIEELDSRTKELLQRTRELNKKVRTEIDVATKLHTRSRNENI